MLAKLVCSALALSLVSPVAAQTTVQKKPPVKKAPAPTKPPAKAPPPTPEPPPPPPPPPPPTDVRVHTKLINGAQISENSAFFKGVRQRYEFPGVTMINQCDAKRSLQLNVASKQYMVVSTQAPAPPPAATPAPETPPDTPDAAQLTAMSKGGRGAGPKPKGGVITETVTLTDTGERKDMFGREARHIRTVMTRQPGPNACEAKTTRVETDGWYVDLPDHELCPSAPPPQPATPPAENACTDRLDARRVGEAKLGFAVASTTTTTTEEGKESESTTSSMEVTDLQVTTIDAALFEAPPDYTEVKSYRELLPALAAGGNLTDALFGSIADGTSAVAPKKAGVIRIGVADPINKTNRNVP